MSPPSRARPGARDAPVPPQDAARLAEALAGRLRGRRPLGYVRGKTRIRDAVMDLTGCSAARAEALVDDLERRGYLRYLGDPTRVERRPRAWAISPEPLA